MNLALPKHLNLTGTAFALASGVLLLLASCGKQDPAATNAVPAIKPAEAPAGDTLKIGHYGSLTGAEATFGRSTDEGIRLAVKEVNERGGVDLGGKKVKVSLTSEDTESKSEKAGDVVRKLIDRDKVVAVLGEVASSSSLEGAPVCQRAKVPTITPSSTNTEVTKVGDYVFRVCFTDPFQGYAGAKFAYEELKVRKIALLVDKASAYADQLSSEYGKAFESMGGQVVATVDYTKGEKDFNARLTSLRDKGCELIFIPGYYTDVANVLIQARALGMKMPIMGGDGWDSEDLAKNAGDALEGCFYTNHYAPDNPSPEITAFLAAYGKEYNGKVPDGLAALGYDAANVLFAAMERAGTTQGQAVRDQIAKTTSHKGVTGSITINEQRDAVKPIVVLERKGGKWVFRAQVNP